MKRRAGTFAKLFTFNDRARSHAVRPDVGLTMKFLIVYCHFRAASAEGVKHFSHGPTGSFQILPFEDLLEEVKVLTEHRTASGRFPSSATTGSCSAPSASRKTSSSMPPTPPKSKPSAWPFMRYQITHERPYYKAQKELQNPKKQKQKAEIGFESHSALVDRPPIVRTGANVGQ